MTFYIVKFTSSNGNSVGVVKKDWMLSSNEVKYPTKHAQQVLADKLKSKSGEKINWRTHECQLKFPKKFGERGLETLKEALQKEKFYVDYTDTEDCNAQKKKKKYERMHPLKKFGNQLDMNDMIAAAINKKKVVVFYFFRYFHALVNLFLIYTHYFFINIYLNHRKSSRLLTRKKRPMKRNQTNMTVLLHTRKLVEAIRMRSLNQWRLRVYIVKVIQTAVAVTMKKASIKKSRLGLICHMTVSNR